MIDERKKQNKTKKENDRDEPSNPDWDTAGIFWLVLPLVRLDQVLEHPHPLRQRHAVRHGVEQLPGPRAEHLCLGQRPARLRLVILHERAYVCRRGAAAE